MREFPGEGRREGPSEGLENLRIREEKGDGIPPDSGIGPEREGVMSPLWRPSKKPWDFGEIGLREYGESPKERFRSNLEQLTSKLTDLRKTVEALQPDVKERLIQDIENIDRLAKALQAEYESLID